MLFAELRSMFRRASKTKYTIQEAHYSKNFKYGLYRNDMCLELGNSIQELKNLLKKRIEEQKASDEILYFDKNGNQL